MEANKNSESISSLPSLPNSKTNEKPKTTIDPNYYSVSYGTPSLPVSNKHHYRYNDPNNLKIHEASNPLPPNPKPSPTIINKLETNIKPLSYSEMEKITDNFNSKKILGKGGFGTVYMGKYINMSVAVKVLLNERLNDSYIEKFSLNEIEYLNRYRHDNILPMYGYSIDGKKLCLMCQFMSNGSLYDRLQCQGGTEPLPWSKRVLIANGVAKGLQFLHQMNPPLYHGDIKSPNVLLDEYFVPKIGDFGLAREGPQQLTRVFGTREYLPPTYSTEKKLTAHIDIYSFGVVLFELATGLKPKGLYDSTQKRMFLKDHVSECVETGRIMDIIDPNVEQGSNFFQSLILLGLECIKDQLHQRPSMMIYVTDKLGNLQDQIADLQEPLPKDSVLLNDRCRNLRTEILTKDDFDRLRQGLDPQIYDVFILYVKEDYSCADHIRKILTVHYNLKVCDQNVDLMEGHAFDSYSIVTKLMNKRCHKIMVILSEDFSKSIHHVSLFEHAYSNTYQNGFIKVIPCISRRNNLPSTFCQYFSLNYEYEGNSEAFRERLLDSIISQKKGFIGFQKMTKDNNDPIIPFKRPKCCTKSLICKFLALINLKQRPREKCPD